MLKEPQKATYYLPQAANTIGTAVIPDAEVGPEGSDGRKGLAAGEPRICSRRLVEFDAVTIRSQRNSLPQRGERA